MAPFADSNNPLGAGNEQPRYGGAYLIYAVTNTTLPTVGQIVMLKSPYTTKATTGGGDWGATPPVTAKAIKAATATAQRLIGVCVGGATLGTNPVKTGTIMVCSEGIAQVNMLGATTANHSVIVTTAHAGNGKDAATPTLGKTLGVVLQTHATATTPKKNSLVTCYIHKV